MYLKIIKFLFGIEIVNIIFLYYIYIKNNKPKTLNHTKQEVQQIIKEISKLNKDEIEFIFKGCIISHKNKKSIDDLNINDLDYIEIKNICYSLIGDNHIKNINRIVNLIENKIKHKFTHNNKNRFTYAKWYNNEIGLNYKPFLFKIPIVLYYHINHFFMKNYFNYHISYKTNIHFLYNISKNKKTILFIHGFGFSYIPYINYLLELDKTYNIVILIIPIISNNTMYNFNCNFPSDKNLQNTVYEFLLLNEIYKCNIIAHSFGTYISNILLNDDRNYIINKVILFDPIIFSFSYIKSISVIENYKQHTNFFDFLIDYYIFKCFYVKYISYRHIENNNIIYDFKTIKNNILIILEENDNVIPIKLIKKELIKYNKNFIEIPNTYHGQIFFDGKYKNLFFEIVNNYFN
jgi:pimeloyl-ACP methyl ester carboxylesterase